MQKINSLKELKIIADHGASVDLIHDLHGELIQCTKCLEHVIERMVSGWKDSNSVEPTVCG